MTEERLDEISKILPSKMFRYLIMSHVQRADTQLQVHLRPFVHTHHFPVAMFSQTDVLDTTSIIESKTGVGTTNGWWNLVSTPLPYQTCTRYVETTDRNNFIL